MDTITTGQAAQLLGTTMMTIGRLIADGTIPAVRLGGDKSWWRIERADMEAYAAERNIKLDWSLIDKQ